jgi:hypothetical protein
MAIDGSLRADKLLRPLPVNHLNPLGAVCGMSHGDVRFPETLPGAAEAVLDAGDQQFMLLIRLTGLRHLLRVEQAAGLAAAALGHCLAVSPLLMKRLGRWLEGILPRTHRAPEMLQHPAAVETLERTGT